jgi:DNA-binding MarR family transcriptional regulator
LTSPQLGVLREILGGENISPGTLALALHLSQPTVTGILGRLESRGLIRRERSTSDRRSVLVVATEQGKHLADKAPPLLRDRFRSELAKLADVEQSEILSRLEHVAAMMQVPAAVEAPFFFHEASSREGKRPKRVGSRAKARPKGGKSDSAERSQA